MMKLIAEARDALENTYKSSQENFTSNASFTPTYVLEAAGGSG
jgi:hypothetical protein